MTRRLGLFEGIGVEIETMIVDADTLAVAPVADRLIDAEGGSSECEITRGSMAWSNELVLHVLEFKTNGPAPSLVGLAEHFQGEVRHANQGLAALGARLLPGGMHPCMDPARETRLWPHEYNDVYRAFDRLFTCAGHGWANLQSTHINLPFAGDRELHALHSAIRVVLPLIPALAASSPLQDGRPSGALDGRLVAYRGNARRIPSVAGAVVPDVIRSEGEYHDRILEPIYRDLAPHDPEGILRHEWVNARGAIARFERGAVEIRLIDAQECPAADLAVVGAVVAVVRWLTESAPGGTESLDALDTPVLSELLGRTILEGERARVDHPAMLRALGLDGATPRTAGWVWSALIDRTLGASDRSDEWAPALYTIERRGCLARRILEALDIDDGPATLTSTVLDGAEVRAVYARLADCLAGGELFGQD